MAGGSLVMRTYRPPNIRSGGTRLARAPAGSGARCGGGWPSTCARRRDGPAREGWPRRDPRPRARMARSGAPSFVVAPLGPVDGAQRVADAEVPGGGFRRYTQLLALDHAYVLAHVVVAVQREHGFDGGADGARAAEPLAALCRVVQQDHGEGVVARHVAQHVQAILYLLDGRL